MADGPSAPENQSEVGLAKAKDFNSETLRVSSIVNKSSLKKPRFLFYGIDFSKGVVERIDHGSTIYGLGEFYGLSQKRIKRISETTEAWVLDDNTFDEVTKAGVEADMRRIRNHPLLEEEDKKNLLGKLQFDKDHSWRIGGRYFGIEYAWRSLFLTELFGKEIRLPYKKTQQIIVRENFSLGKNHTEIHEFMHALGAHKDMTTGLELNNNRYRSINEAATEILTLAFMHKNLSGNELLDKIDSGEIKAAYRDQVKALLAMMFVATPNGKPFTFNELADYYFQEKPKHDTYFLLGNFPLRVREQYRERAQNLLNSDFNTKTV